MERVAQKKRRQKSQGWHSPCRVKLKRAGKSLGGLLGCRESGNRVVGSRSSSKKGWHMASMADSRWVGVYSKSAEMRSMASGGALRKTWVGQHY